MIGAWNIERDSLEEGLTAKNEVAIDIGFEHAEAVEVFNQDEVSRVSFAEKPGVELIVVGSSSDGIDRIHSPLDGLFYQEVDVAEEEMVGMEML